MAEKDKNPHKPADGGKKPAEGESPTVAQLSAQMAQLQAQMAQLLAAVKPVQPAAPAADEGPDYAERIDSAWKVVAKAAQRKDNAELGKKAEFYGRLIPLINEIARKHPELADNYGTYFRKTNSATKKPGAELRMTDMPTTAIEVNRQGEELREVVEIYLDNDLVAINEPDLESLVDAINADPFAAYMPPAAAAAAAADTPAADQNAPPTPPAPATNENAAATPQMRETGRTTTQGTSESRFKKSVKWTQNSLDWLARKNAFSRVFVDSSSPDYWLKFKK